MKRIAVDIGGTFTDIVYFDDDTAQTIIDKVRSTPQDVGRAVLQAVEKIKADLPKITQFVHGTTVGLNALLERKGSRVGLITTSGFIDIVEMARGDRKELYNYLWKKPRPLVPRYLRLGVKERINFLGRVSQPLKDGEVKEIAETLKQNRVEAVAVCLLHSYANPEHEQKIETILQEIWPDVTISLSHQIAREFREYERTSTTVIDAYTKKKIVRYLGKLSKDLKNKGFGGQLLIAGPSGVIGAGIAEKNSLYTISSGPTGGCIGAVRLSRMTGFKDLLIMDVGGTSFDVGIIKDSEVVERHESELMGFPVIMPSIDIRSIGAGGGSIARVDAGGLLAVGPESAGGNPGPMCYGLGGTRPTVTDAALVNGLINPAYFLGGEISLDVELAKKGVGEIAAQLGLSINEAAQGILALARNNMTNASSEILVGQGYDPRDFTILAYGGGGGIFAEGIARDMVVKRVVIPPAPGVFCAWGMLSMDIVHNYSRTYARSLENLEMKMLEGMYGEMETGALDVLKDENVSPETVEMLRSVDMCYSGQGHYVEVPLPSKGLVDKPKKEISAAFHQLHEGKYGHRLAAPIRVINVRLKAIGKLKDIPVEEIKPGNKVPAGAAKPSRQVFMDGRVVDCRIYERGKLLSGNAIHGPAIVEEPQHTTIVAHDQVLTVDRWGNLIIELRGK
jgi:N-methylhydantoinase A